MRVPVSWGCWQRAAPAAALAALLAAALPAPLRAGPPVTTEAGEPADARSWLARIHAAAQQRNYQGTMVFSAGGMLSSSKVAHFAQGGETFERLESLDGRQRRVVRVNDTVHTLWPAARLAIVEKRGALTRSLPSATQAVDPRVLEQYELQREGVDRVAGRDALVFLLKPRDELRYAQRLWADKATGLLLRNDVVAPNRSVLESAAFTEVEIGLKAPPPDSFVQAARPGEGWRVARPQHQSVQLEAEGWTLTRAIPGFVQTGSVKRALEADGPPVLQAVYTDGLTHVSLFIEPVDPSRPTAELGGQVGATGALRQRRGDHWVTVMGDVPPATLRAFADALDHRRR